MSQRITYVAVCPNFWGRGITPKIAIDNAKRAGGRRYKSQYTVYKIACEPSKISISDIDGSINYPKGTPVEVIQRSTLAKKAGEGKNESTR